MILITGDIQIEYGCTKAGQFYEAKTLCQGVRSIKTTPNAANFLKWITDAIVKEEVETLQRNILLERITPWWNRCTGESHGFFNEELYFKLIKAKKQHGLL